MKTLPVPPTVADALARLGEPDPSRLLRPVQFRPKGTLVSIAEIDPQGHLTWRGALLPPTGPIEWLGPPLEPEEPSAAPLHDAARLSRTILHAARNYLDRLAEIDETINERTADGGIPTIAELSHYQRLISRLRSQIGRLVLLLNELEGRLGASFPGIAEEIPQIRSTVLDLPELSSHFEDSLRELLLLRDSHESNRLAAAANELSANSNRIASLANSSNVRMLGLAYLALVIALIGAVIVIPNTAATILGMPSAGWVPGPWVDLVLVVTALVPLVVVLSRPWVRAILSARPQFEQASAEGMKDLPELRIEETASGREWLIPRPP